MVSTREERALRPRSRGAVAAIRSHAELGRRIALVSELPTSVQEHARSGAIGAHAAMKYLVPLARAKAEDCARLADAIAPSHPSSRQMGELYATYASGNAEAREPCVRSLHLVLRARAETKREGSLSGQKTFPLPSPCSARPTLGNTLPSTLPPILRAAMQ